MATRRTALPAATTPLEKAVKEILEVGTGQRGDELDRFVTLRDLCNAAIIRYLNQQDVSVTNPDGAGGLAGSRSLLPPSNLHILKDEAAGQITAFNHHLKWDNPDDDNVTSIEIWGHTANIRGESLKLGLAPITQDYFIHHNPDPTTDYFYWIRSIDMAGNYSPWEPTDAQGGFVVPGDEALSDTIERVLDVLKGQDPAWYAAGTTYSSGDMVRYTCTDGATRRYEYVNVTPAAGQVPEDNPTYWKRSGILTVGQVDGEDTVGVDGNLVVDNTILARHVKADNIDGTHISATSQITVAEGGYVMVGNNNIKLDGDTDSIIVAPDGGPAGQDYCQLKNGNLWFYLYDSTTLQHFPYKSIKRLETGYASNGQTVQIPGYWKQQPVVMVSVENATTYNATYPTQTQRLVVGAESVTEYSNMQYQFTAAARLELDASGGSVAASNDLTVYGAQFHSYLPGPAGPALPANTRRVLVNVRFVPMHGVGVLSKAGGAAGEIAMQIYKSGAWTTVTAFQAGYSDYGAWPYYMTFDSGTQGADITYFRFIGTYTWTAGAEFWTTEMNNPAWINSYLEKITLQQYQYWQTGSIIVNTGTLRWIAIGE